MERIWTERQNPVFKLIRTQLANKELPISTTDGINSWENLELTLLKLEDTQFEILYKDRLDQIKEIDAAKLLQKSNITKRKKKKDKTELSSADHAVPLNEIEDPFIKELERTFRSGDKKSVLEMMSKYK